ncbi:MAG: tetratricopeptide repeat protein [Bacteroidota bacterium]
MPLNFNYLKRFHLLFFSLLFFCSSLNAQDVDALFQQANELYQAKDYQAAVQQYESILSAGFRSADLYYNIGNCYYQDGSLGKAILHYERAALMAPGDKDIQYNLALAGAQVKDELAKIPSFFLTRWWSAVHRSMSSGSWSVWMLLFCWLGMGGLAVWLMGTNRQQRKRGFLAGLILLLCSGLCWGLTRSQKAFETSNPYGIILSEETALRSGPDESSTELLPLHEGTKVRILDQLGPWKKVRLPDGDQGWLADEVLERI